MISDISAQAATPVSRISWLRHHQTSPHAGGAAGGLGALEHVSRNDGILATGDALADPILGIRDSIRRIRIRSLVNVPIRDGTTVIGALYMDHRQQTDLFGEEERLFLQFIAEMASIGIQNARRYEAAREEAESNSDKH